MWAWAGGSGECGGFTGHCWYSFSVDGTSNYFSSIGWPTESGAQIGQLLSDPAGEARLRFPGLAQLTSPYRYNPYIPTPPTY